MSWYHVPRCLFVAALVVVSVGCQARITDEIENFTCFSTVEASSAASPSTGTVTINGAVDPEEQLLLGYVEDGGATRLVPGSVGNGGLVTFAGLPTGKRTFHFIVQCGNLQEDHGSGQITVM